MAATVAAATAFGSGAVTGVTTATVTTPAGSASGDVLICFANDTAASHTWSAPGFTAVTAATGTNGSCQVLYRVLDGSGSDPGATFTVTTTSGQWSGICVRVTGANTASPFDPAPTSGQVNAGSTSITAASITTTVNGDLLIWFGGGRVASGAPPAITLPGGYTDSGAGQVNTSSAAANTATIAGFTTQATAGATGSVTGTWSSATANVGVLLGIQAAPAASTAGNRQPLPRPAARAQSRARLGARGLCAAGILAAGITAQPGAAVPPPKPRVVITHPAPHRAAWRGITGQAYVAVPPPRQRPWLPRSPAPHRAAWRSVTGAGPSPQGPSRPPQPVPVIRHAVPHRAAAGGVAARGPLLQDFEHGPAGTPVTTANSGGGNDVAFTAVSVPAGAALTFDNTDAAHGTQCAHFTTDVTGETCYLQWGAVPAAAGYGQAWFRFYLKFAALPAANVRVMTMLQSGTLCGYVQLLTTGKLQWVGQNGVAIVTTATSVPSGQWVRAEGYLTGAAATGTAELKLFLSMDSTAADETQTSGATAHTTGAPDTYRFGVGAAVASIDYRLDDIGISTVGYLGPSAAAAPGVAVPPPLWRPQPRSPVPHAASWRGRAVAPGQPQGPSRLPLPLRRPGPHRAITGGVRGPQPSAAAPGVAVPPPGWHPQPRFTPAHRVTWRAVAGLPAPAQTVTTAPPRQLPQVPHRAPSRALWRVLRGAPATAQPAAVPPPRQPPQVPRKGAARALWRGRAAPPRLPTLPVPHPAAVPRQAPHRVIWRLVTGQPPAVPGVAVRAPGLIPQPRHLPPARGTWRRLAGPGNAAPPVVTYGTAVAGTMAIPAALAGQAAAAHTDAGTTALPAAAATAGQAAAAAAQSGQMTIPHAEGGQ